MTTSTTVKRNKETLASDVLYVHHKELYKSLQALKRRGGVPQRAAQKVLQILGNINIGDPQPFHGIPLTNHGENRISHCVKYDIAEGYRLITVKNEKICLLCFAGNHDESESWITRNRGLTLTRNPKGEWEPTFVTRNLSDPIHRSDATTDLIDSKLMDRLPAGLADELLIGIAPTVIHDIWELDTTCAEDELATLCGRIPDGERASLVYDVLAALMSADVDRASRRINLYRAKSTPVKDLPSIEVVEIKDGDAVKRLPINSDEYRRWLNDFARTAQYYDWFLFMHPEQEEIVRKDFSGPAKLSGVSGSGKTCIVVRRAIRLARELDGARILILTLNKSLAALIANLVDYACSDEEIARRIEVKSFFGLCQELLVEFEPGSERQYLDVNWKLGEHIDEVFHEFYRCGTANNDAAVMLPVHRTLTSLGLSGEAYIRQEFDWIRSALAPGARGRYLELERKGRKLPIPADRRQLLLDGLLGWERKMKNVGVIDYLGLTTELQKHLDKLLPRYSSILVDEAQDFGTTELSIIAKLILEQPNNLFLSGDVAQHVLPKHQSFADAGIDVKGRSLTIRRNYRNTREILKAAYEILVKNLDDDMLSTSDLEILDPEFASRSSPKPLVLEAESLEFEIAHVYEFVRDIDPPQTVCVSFAGFTLLEIQKFGKQIGFPVLDGSVGILDGRVFLSDLEQAKGYEFDTVIILNCRHDVLPPATLPADEAYRHSCLLYVAMTRAKNELILSHSGPLSPWIEACREYFIAERWNDTVPVTREQIRGAPIHLSETFDEDLSVFDMRGREFLYTAHARGLSLEAQSKLDELVDGVGLIRGRERLRWRTIRELADDIEKYPAVRRQLGPKVSEEIGAILAPLRDTGLTARAPWKPGAPSN